MSFSNSVIVVGGAKLRVIQRLNMLGRGRLILGSGVNLGVYPSPGFERGEFYIEARSEEATVILGNNVYINNGATIIADKTFISIGDNTLIGGNFFCVDSNFHSLAPAERLSGNYTCRPVNIGKNVLIGESVIVLRGVNVGDNSVIGAGCIVSNDVPPNTILKVADRNELLQLRF